MAAPSAQPAAPRAAMPAMPDLPPLPTFTIRDTPVTPEPAAEPVQPAGPVVITEDMLGDLTEPVVTPIVTTMPSAPPLTALTTPTKVTTFEPARATTADGTPAAAPRPARPSRGRPTARRPRSAGSVALKVAIVALLLTAGWFAWSALGDDGASTAPDGSAPVVTNEDGQAQIMPPTQVGLPPIQVVPGPGGEFLVTVGPVQFAMPSLPTQTGASDPSQPALAAVKFTASGPAGVLTAVVSLDTRPITAETRAAFCDVALAGTLVAESGAATADTVESQNEPHIRTARFDAPTGVGDFHCHYDDVYAVVFTGIGVDAPMGPPFARAVATLDFHA